MGADIQLNHTIETIHPQALRDGSTDASERRRLVDELEERLRFETLLGPIRVEPGCLSCRLFAEICNGEGLLYVEEWETPEQLERHMRSARYERLLAVMEASARRCCAITRFPAPKDWSICRPSAWARQPVRRRQGTPPLKIGLNPMERSCASPYSRPGEFVAPTGRRPLLRRHNLSIDFR